MTARIGALCVSRVQVGDDLLGARNWGAVAKHENRDLVIPRPAAELVALRSLLGHGSGDEWNAQLGEPLPDPVGVRAPFSLIELVHTRSATRPTPQ
jgi:hypothetical protein